MALHALAMFSFPASRPASHSDQARELTALFISEPAPPPAPSRPRVRREPEAPTPLPSYVEPAPVAAPQAVELVPAPAPAEPQALASAAPQVPAAPPARLDSTVVDPSLFDAYRLALINAAKRYKRYPLQAMERGWEGRVEIRVVVDANGTIKNALVKTSSSFAVLDEQALNMVKKAFNDLAQAAPRGREFTVDVPVIFELQAG